MVATFLGILFLSTVTLRVTNRHRFGHVASLSFIGILAKFSCTALAVILVEFKYMRIVFKFQPIFPPVMQEDFRTIFFSFMNLSI